jgi:hypothetical protein
MPVIRPEQTNRPVQTGDFFVNRRSGALVEIMHVHLSGNVMVLDVTAPLDGEWLQLTASQISSCLWVRASEYVAAA